MEKISISQLDIHVGAILPEITLAVFALIVVIADLFPKQFGNKQLAALSIFGLAAAEFMNILLWWQPETTFFGMITIDAFAIVFKSIALLATAVVILMSLSYVEAQRIKHGEYYSLILFATIGMMFLISGTDMVVLFIGLETIALSSYLLAGFNLERYESTESAMKYFVLGAFSTGFLLYGIVLLYGVTGSTNFMEIKQYFTSVETIPLPLWLGIGLLTIGLAFKIGAVPFHFWVPDVYEGAPTPITAFFSIGPKVASFAIFLRIVVDTLSSVHEQWTMLFWVLAAITMTIGNITAVFQTNIKRMLAYSSISQAGYLLVAVVAGNELGYASIMFYLFVYIFMNLGAFTVVLLLNHKDKEYLQIKEYGGLAKSSPFLAFTMAIFMLSLAGIPPTAGFIGKFYIFSAAVKSGFIWLAIIGVINSLISVYYYMRITIMMYMKEATIEIAPHPGPVMVSVLILSVWGSLFFGFFPGSILELALRANPF